MSIEQHVTNLEQSQALDRLAKSVEAACHTCEDGQLLSTCPSCKASGFVHPYPKGLSDWLASRKCQTCGGDGETTFPGIGAHYYGESNRRLCLPCHGTGHGPLWPSHVWTKFLGELNPNSKWEQKYYECPPLDEYVHALVFEQAFEFLEECYDWNWERVAKRNFATSVNLGITEGGAGTSLPELLNKMLAAMEEEARQHLLLEIGNDVANRHSILPENVAEICRHYEDTVVALEARLAELEEALRWYLEDDKRAVEQGILESVDLRPAAKVLR